MHAFLRCSEALKCVARGKFALAMTSFFDDFTVISTKASAAHVVSVVRGMFRRLGWQEVAAEEKKNHPFSEVFDVLGVRVDLSQQTEGLVFTPSRRDELKASINEMLKLGHTTFEESQRLRGRLVFAEQSVCGAAVLVKQSSVWATRRASRADRNAVGRVGFPPAQHRGSSSQMHQLRRS